PRCSSAGRGAAAARNHVPSPVLDCRLWHETAPGKCRYGEAYSSVLLMVSSAIDCRRLGLPQILLDQSAWLRSEVRRQFALGDVPATISVPNLSAAMAFVSHDSPLRAWRSRVSSRIIRDEFERGGLFANRQQAQL